MKRSLALGLALGLVVPLGGCGDDGPRAPASAGADEARALDEAGQMVTTPRPSASSPAPDATATGPAG